MRAGSLTERVALKRLDTALSSASTGALVESWPVVATVWAKVDPTGGSEGVAGAQRFAETQIAVRIRFRADVLVTWRLEWRGQSFDIKSLVPGGHGLREWIDLVATASPAENPE